MPQKKQSMAVYQEKHGAWEVFKTFFWGIYLLVIGVVLTVLVPGVIGFTSFIGLAVVLAALFLIIFGFTASLHLKLVKKYS
ncbi:MAG TPA: hypothetical protein VND15_03895 [Candidatus Acidoferrales bacterium]|nr:hypothetical protein [Candidatus Acidoferrales bacterium]